MGFSRPIIFSSPPCPEPRRQTCMDYMNKLLCPPASSGVEPIRVTDRDPWGLENSEVRKFISLASSLLGCCLLTVCFYQRPQLLTGSPLQKTTPLGSCKWWVLSPLAPVGLRMAGALHCCGLRAVYHLRWIFWTFIFTFANSPFIKLPSITSLILPPFCFQALNWWRCCRPLLGYWHLFFKKFF